MTWISLALLAPLMYAASNVIDKYALEQHTTGIADYMVFASLGSVCLAIVLYEFGGAHHAEWRHVGAAFASGCLMNVSYLLFAICLTKVESYQLTPYFLLIPILLLALDALFFGASFSAFSALAVALSLAGSGMLASTDSPTGRWRLSVRGPGLLMLMSVLLLACAVLLMDKWGNPAATGSFVMFQSIGFAASTLLYLARRPWRLEILAGIRSMNGPKIATFAANDAADLLGNWLFVSAVAAAPAAGYVSLALGVQPVYVIVIVFVLGRLNPALINERVSSRKMLRALVGTGLIASGLAILATVK